MKYAAFAVAGLFLSAVPAVVGAAGPPLLEAGDFVKIYDPAVGEKVIQDVDGKWYVSRCGAGRGGVYLAPLTWKDGQP